MGNLIWTDKDKIGSYKSLKKNFSDKNYSFQVIESTKSPLIANHERNVNDNSQIATEKVNSSETAEDWENLLFQGDNSLAILELLEKFAGKINLIYIDPPFATGGDFNYKIQIGESEASKRSAEWVRKIAYKDTWKKIDSYLNFMYERLLLMKELLADNGSIFIHLDWHAVHYIKIIMDEIFGPKNFRNEIIWPYPAASVQTKKFFVRSFDAILFYTKSDDYVFNDDSNIYMEYSDRVKNALKKDEKGIYYHRGGSHDGKKLTQKVYIKKKGVFPRDVWNDIPYIRANTIEYQGFSTQKPERLLKRIILASTNKNDLIADFFCGSGTTLAVAEKLGRRWIGCDRERHSVHLIRKRLLTIHDSNNLFDWKKKYERGVSPFKILNLKETEQELSIPRDFLSGNKQGKVDLQIVKKPFFKVSITNKINSIIIELQDYIIPFIDSINEKIKNNVQKWGDWIDFWAIDFNYKDPAFNNMWASYRTPKNRNLTLRSSPYKYINSANFSVMIKVIDIFGIESLQKHEIHVKS